MFKFESSNGLLVIDKQGYVIAEESDLSEWLLDVERVDVEELENYYKLNSFDEISVEGDVLDFGFWNKKGEYNSPEMDWRKENFHNVDFSDDEVETIIAESIEWIKNNRLESENVVAVKID
jgi:hypothetical protein